METQISNNELNIEILQIKKAALVLRAVNHKLRQLILNLIHQNGRMTVTSLYIKLRLEQSVTSQHLAILRKAGFVLTERNGKNIFYTVHYKRLEEVHQYCDLLLGKDHQKEESQ